MDQTKQKNNAAPSEVEVRCILSDLKIEQRGDESGQSGRTISGYAAKFDSWSEPIYGWFREKIAQGAFEKCDMTDAIMCFNHDINGILARTSSGTLTLAVDKVGLHFEFNAPGTTLGNDMVELVSRGDVSKCSFKFIVETDEWRYADEKNGLEYDERTIKSISKLYDVSLVTYPAYPDTEAGVRSLLEQRKKEALQQQTPSAVDTTSRDRMARMLSLKR